MDSVISKYSPYIESQIRETYESCVLPDKLKEWICTQGSQSQSLNTIQSSLSRYTWSEVEEAYTGCVAIRIDDVTKFNLCIFQKN